MPRLEWGQAEQRTYQRGIDRGVLYPSTGAGVAWNGLTNVVEEAVGAAVTPHYYDGIKYLDEHVPGDYAATLTAITYPDEFVKYEGVRDFGYIGLRVSDQEVDDYFGLSYRTRVGNAAQGDDHGYKLHLLYNLTALPENKSYATINNTGALTPFSWRITGVPVYIPNARPTVHITIDTTKLGQAVVTDIEDILYGDPWRTARMPTPEELIFIIDNWEPLVITDHGDGTWSATGSDTDIRMLSGEEPIFWIEGDSAYMLDNYTYRITGQA